MDAWKASREHAANPADRTSAVALEVHCDDAPTETIWASTFLRHPDVFEDWERQLLAACRGRVLDVGAGGGAHALWLREHGHAVTALDIDPACAQVMRARGLGDVRCGTLADIEGESFDTLLFAMHGIGVAGDLMGLCWLLAEAWRLMDPEGIVLLDSASPCQPILPAEPGSDYPGECELWMRYGEITGGRFPWLFVDDISLGAIAARVGLHTEVIHRETNTQTEAGTQSRTGRYIARLRRSKTATDMAAPSA